ncbi:hypothetical protein Poli38472_003768 [Pythium oligandrum]|uniref:Peptidase A1 domain-containing protein n=1 Tax=Pythium oligandrum TaxID=41045 RepID=A0A8K1CN84_PYTOL|nr:hypothetical protein Poli38472_003768 [Pythium oligandrum]|eukprot:TMW66003.1 hypothetical protein Poli38472_003768 [Pythium oligandrum]
MRLDRVLRWAAIVLLHGALLCANGDSEVIRLAMNRRPRNMEVEHLIAQVKTQQVYEGLPNTDLHEENDQVHVAETRIHVGEGSHTINVVVGGQSRELIIDTGSGKTAFVCEQCRECGVKHVHPPFQFTNQTKYSPCDPHLIGDDVDGGCMECHASKCQYSQRYVEGDYWEAYKVSDEMWFSSPAFKATVEFGCIYEQTGCFTEETSDGIMGFSRHRDSIYEQYYRQGVTQSRIFAQCLAPDGGTLTLGGVDMAINMTPVMYTPLRDTGYQYWTVNLESISVGETPLQVSDTIWNAGRGCVFDSGTTFVYLPTGARTPFQLAWAAAVGTYENLPVSDSYHHIQDATFATLPPICFHFTNNAKLCMKPEAYLYRLSSTEYAGTLFFGDNVHSTIIGANALMHHNIIYDVDNHRIGMAEADCDRSSMDVAPQERALEIDPGGETFRVAFDHLYWMQCAIASVAVLAVAGLVSTAWREIRELQEEDVKEAAAKSTTGTEKTEDTAFAFILMDEYSNDQDPSQYQAQ